MSYKGKENMRKIVFLCLVIILFVVSDAEAKSINTTYEDKKSGFSITYPNTWRETQTAPGAVFSILKKDKSAGISVNVTDSEVDKNTMIKEMETGKSRNYFISELKQRYPNAKMIDHKRTFLGKEPAMLFSVKYSTKVSNAYSQMISTEIIGINGKKMYSVNFDCVESAYTVNYEDFKKIIDTFSFK